MKLRSLLVLLSVSTLFMVSCAHKKMGVDEGAKHSKAEKKAETMIAKSKTGDGYTCLVAGDKRTVSLNKKEKKCAVHYTKFGKKEKMAWGQSNLKICDDVYTNIRENIEKRGFKCTTGIDKTENHRKTASAK